MRVGSFNKIYVIGEMSAVFTGRYGRHYLNYMHWIIIQKQYAVLP